MGALGGPTQGHPPPADIVMARETSCARGRMVMKGSAGLCFQACPLTDDATRFDCGNALDAALTARVVPDHPRCQHCLDPGVDYAGT